MVKPITWTIAGSDSSGGAGIQADLLTFHALGVHGCSIVTALTAQNTTEVTDIAITPANHLQKQFETLNTDLPPHAIKIGMLPDVNSIDIVANFLNVLKEEKHHCPIVCDPVMVSTSGSELMENNALAAYQEKIIPLADILTPNKQEAEKLAGMCIRNVEDSKQAANTIMALGCKSVLIKGGHFENTPATDYWTNGEHAYFISNERFPHAHTHGSGCTLSSAIAAFLALGETILDSITTAKAVVTKGIADAKPLGNGVGPVQHVTLDASVNYLPTIHTTAHQPRLTFPTIALPIGLYPIVDSDEWLEQLIPLGITTIQLRIKDKPMDEVEITIIKAIEYANKTNTQLFINDYWQLAIKHGAYGIHLGQGDLLTADLQTIADAGIRLGISTHSYAELAIAQHVNPSYIAFGPIFETQTKAMPYSPQGLKRLQLWRNLVKCPLVAIGGISLDTIQAVSSSNPDGIALISAITQANDPIDAAKALLLALNS